MYAYNISSWTPWSRKESDMTEGLSLTHNIPSKHIKEKFIATVKNRQIDLVMKDFKTISSSKYF